MEKFKDNATRPIIAWDFDNTITVGDVYPKIGPLRLWSMEVMNLLHELGVINIIWTCRDRWPDTIPSDALYDDITPVINYLDGAGIYYDGINKMIEHAPFHYESRKIYAHMYVDDKAFGWEDKADILLDVLVCILIKILGIPASMAYGAAWNIKCGREVDIDELKAHIHGWRL